MAMSSEGAEAEARRLAGLLAEKEKEVEKLKKELEENVEVADQLDAQLEEALRRLKERAARQHQQAAPADSTEMEEEMEALNEELHSVRSYCIRLERSLQHARKEQDSQKWAIIDLTWQLQQAEPYTPAWYQQKMQQDRAGSRERRVAWEQQQQARRQQRQQQQQQQPAGGLLQLFKPARRDEQHRQPAAARQPPPAPQPAAAPEVPTAGVGMREVTPGVWTRVFAAGLGAYVLLVLALIVGSSVSPGVEPMAFSGTSVIKAVSAVGREVGYRAGVAMQAEDAVALWRKRFHAEERGREAAEQQASTLQAELHLERQQLLRARQTIEWLEHQHRSSEQQRLALEDSLAQQEQEKSLVVSQRNELRAELTLVEDENDDLQALVTKAEADLAAEKTKTQQLEEELSLERAAVSKYSERVDVEVTARRDAESLAVRLVADMLDARDQLSQCAQQRSSCSNALTGCHHERKQAELRANRLRNDKQYACVGWLSDMASQLKSALFSPVPGPTPSHADTYASSSTVYYN